MIFITIIFLVVVALNFYTINNLKKERDFYKDRAAFILAGKNPASKFAIMRELERIYHTENPLPKLKRRPK
jgi:hypothetical protein